MLAIFMHLRFQAADCIQLDQMKIECMKIMSVTLGPSQLPELWANPDPSTYWMDSCKPQVSFDWHSPVATIRYSRNSSPCDISNAKFKLEYINDP